MPQVILEDESCYFLSHQLSVVLRRNKTVFAKSNKNVEAADLPAVNMQSFVKA